MLIRSFSKSATLCAFSATLFAFSATLLAFDGSAQAQWAEGAEADPADPSQSGLLSDEQALYEEESGTAPPRRRSDPHEERDQRYVFLGGFYRHHFLPASMLQLFTQVAPSFDFSQFGLELTFRKNNLDIIATAYYADFGGQGAFLGKGDPHTDVEWIESNLSAVMGGVTFLWGTAFNDVVSLQYGIGFGVGATMGNLRRTEAYPTADGYAACQHPNAPRTPGSAQPDQPFVGDVGESVQQYCAAPNHPTATSDADGEDGEHYGIHTRRWFDGGSLPNLWFRLAPQLSLRIKPIHQLVFRIDAGWDIFSGMFVGGAVAFGF